MPAKKVAKVRVCCLYYVEGNHILRCGKRVTKTRLYKVAGYGRAIRQYWCPEHAWIRSYRAKMDYPPPRPKPVYKACVRCNSEVQVDKAKGIRLHKGTGCMYCTIRKTWVRVI